MLLHSATQKALNDFIAQPSHALLITGPEGSGKGSVAQFVASELLGTDVSKLDAHPRVLWLHDQAISIEDIRAAQKLMQLKVPGSKAIRRAIIAEQAQTMSNEAQNAFLKLLEEPPADTVIILTASSTEHLLPTIRSRVQQLHVRPVDKASTTQYFEKDYQPGEIDRAYHLSEGYMGLMQAILSGDASHPLVEQIQRAKTILAGSTYDRLCQIDAIVKDKQVPTFLKALERICHAALVQSALKNAPATKAWKARLQAVVSTEDLLNRNPSAKLLLTDLFLHI